MDDPLATLLDRAVDQRLPPPSTRRRLRRAVGVTQRELAAVLGVSRLTVARWEAGACQPRGVRRSAYAEALARLAETVEARAL